MLPQKKCKLYDDDIYGCYCGFQKDKCLCKDKVVLASDLIEEAEINHVDIGNISDGFHTFNSLYNQRMVLFATICKLCPGRAWKSKRHNDGELPFGGGWFIVGIKTPKGQYTYHYELTDENWNLFNVKELDRAPKWDGHTDDDVNRLLSLSNDAEN